MTTTTSIILKADDKTRAAFSSANANLQKLQTGAAKLNSAFGALGVTVGVGAIAAFAKSGIDAADALNDMSQRLGVSVKDLASFKLAAQLADTSLEGVGKGIQRLTLSMGQAEQGLSTQAKALKTLGVTARDPKEAFFQLADAVANSNDPIKTNAALNDVLGKSYVDLLPLLQQGSSELRKSAQESESFADAMVRLAPEAGKFNDQLDILKNNAATAAARGLVPLVTSFNEYAAALKDVLQNGSLLEKAGFFTLGFISEESLNRISDAGKRVQDYNLQIGKLQQELVHLRDVAGPEASIVKKYEADIARLQKTRAGLIAQARKDAAAVPDKPTGGTNPPNPTAVGSKSDPLASLLGSTDIGKLAAFDKQVALLNARFDGGRKSTELYSQAMTKLVETTFSANFSEFTKQMAEQDETQRLVAEHLKGTNDELIKQQQAWIEVGKALEDEMRTPLENANIEFGRLQELLDRGVISWETYGRAVMKVQDAIEETPDHFKEMDDFFKKFAENAQDSFADFFKNFDKGTDGMLQKFGETIKGLIAEAAAADLARYLFGDAVKGGKGSGIAGSLLSGLGELLSFDGGGYTGDGARTGGLDGKGGFLSVIHPNETVIDHSKGQRAGGGGPSIVQNFYGYNNAPDIKRAAGQGARQVLGMLSGAQRYS